MGKASEIAFGAVVAALVGCLANTHQLSGWWDDHPEDRDNMVWGMIALFLILLVSFVSFTRSNRE